MKTKLFILVLALQAAWVLGTAIRQEYVLRAGQTILLETRPVDPRDLLRGDYVILSYQISDVPVSLFSPPLAGELKPGQTVYVALAKRGEFHEAVRASLNDLEARSGELVIQGRNDPRRWRPPGANEVHLEYNLERYYVAEGAGNPTGKLTVQAVVDKSGRASIKQVFVDGRPYAEAMKPKGR